MLRILQVGLGPLGRRIVTDLYERHLGEVVAAVDVSDGLAGTKLAGLFSGLKSSLVIQRRVEDVKDWSSIDCAIVTTDSSLERCDPTFRELLSHGLAVVSTCEELCYPYSRHPRLAQELDNMARENGGRLLGTGVNPGFLMDAFPVLVTAISKSVRSVEVRRFQDASMRRLPFQKKIGVGLDLESFSKAVRAGTLRHVGLPESLHFIARYAGLTFTRWSEDIVPIRAERDLESGLGPIRAGSVCGVKQEAIALQGDERVIHLEFQAAIGLADPHDRVVIHGDPPIDIVWKGGVHGDTATSAIVLNSIAALRNAAPGLHTMATIPMVACAQRPA